MKTVQVKPPSVMRWIPRLSFLLLFIFLLSCFFSVSRLLKNPESVYASLVAQIEERWEVRLSFKDPRLFFLPWPVLRLKGIRLEPVTERWSLITADETRLSFDFLPLLLGKLRLSGIQIQNAKGNFGGFPLEEVDFKVKRLGFFAAPFDWRAVAAGGREVLRGKGQISFDDWDKIHWANLGLKSEVILDGLLLKEWASGEFTDSFPKIAFSGELKGNLQFVKEKGKSEMPGGASFEIQNFHPGSSSPFSFKGTAQLLWHHEDRLLELQEFRTEAPFGKLDGKGILNIETGEITEVRVSGRKVVLEEAVRYFPGLQSLVPLGIGFSGESEFDVTLQGTMDYLALHANWNLTPAILTYGKVFSKPKDFPAGLNCDFILKGGKSLSGDFSLRVHQTSSKGSFSGLDVQTGEGELTFLTNKFELQGWETLLPFLGTFKPSGSAKILMHWKGNLARPKPIDQTFNVTLENVSLLSAEGLGIQEANALIDVSTLSFRIKDGRFKIGGSPFLVQTEVYGLNENPKGNAHIESARFDPHLTAEHLKVMSAFLEPVSGKAWFKNFETKFLPYFPPSVSLEDLALDLKIGEKIWNLENLSFRALGGDFRFSGSWNGSGATPTLSWDGEIERANLTRYFEAVRPGEKILEGNVFFKGKFQGQGSGGEEIFQNLSGQGTFSAANGEWHSLDFFTPLISVESFQTLRSHHSESTPFTDMKVDWTYAAKKFEAKNFLLLSKEWWVEGEGNLSLKGVLNARLQAYLSDSLTETLLALWRARESGEGKQLGPVPLLLLGHFTKPEVKPEERKMQDFLDDVRARRYRRILARPKLL